MPIAIKSGRPGGKSMWGSDLCESGWCNPPAAPWRYQPVEALVQLVAVPEAVCGLLVVGSVKAQAVSPCNVCCALWPAGCCAGWSNYTAVTSLKLRKFSKPLARIAVMFGQS